MLDDHDIARLDEIYVRKDDCQDIQSAYVEPAEPEIPEQPTVTETYTVNVTRSADGKSGTWEIVK